jgi:hypothetical protein
MNFRSTYILIGVVIVALVALAIYVGFSDSKKTNPSVEGYLMRQLRSADVKPDAINYVEIERPGQTPDKIAFTREEKRWVMVAPSKARCEGAAVESIVSAIVNAKTEKAADLSSNLAAHGLDNPPVKVTLKKSQGDSEEYWVAFGNVTIGGSNAVVYVKTSDEPNKPQAAKRTDFSALFKSDVKSATTAGQLVKGPSDFRPMKVIGDGATGPLDQVVRSMRVIAGKDEIALFREPGGNWKFRVPPDYGEAATDAAEPFGAAKDGSGGINSVSQLINTISNIQPANREAIKEAGGDFAKFGLAPNQNPVQIDFSRDDGVKETMFVGGPIKRTSPKKEGEKSEVEYDAYFARNEADSVVYEVPAEPVKKVLAVLSNKGALRDRTVLRLNPQRIDAIDIDANGDKFELRRVGFGWQVYDAEGKGRPASPKAVNELINRLTVKQLATSFPPPGVPDDKMGFSKPSAEVKFWEGGIVPLEKAEPPKKDEPAPKPKVIAPPTARLVFGLPDVGDVVYARRFVGDAKADFFVPVDAFKLASRGRLDYIDGTPKPLDINLVRKLTITHGKEAIEVERTDDDKPAAQASWKINGPDRLKGRPADASNIAHLLNQLANINATRVVSDKVTPDVLNRLKVNPDDPRMKVAIAVKGQDARIYLFGDDVGTEKKAVYMKPGDQDLVFEVDRFAFDQLQKADVQDMVVHRIDKLKIKAVKITDWQEVLGSPTTLEIELKEGKWALKGGMFELDANKVDAFLNDLMAPKADAFVVYKTGPTPEHNLDVNKNAMAVELTMETGDPVKIVISPPNKEGKVFATSSLSPGDVFTMQDKFATIRAKPAALKKD